MVTDEARAGEPRTELLKIAAAMVRGEGTCEKGHRAGKSEHVHFDTVHGWGRRLALIFHAIEREAAAELWQQGYAAGLERGRQPDNHPEAVAAPALDPERLAQIAHTDRPPQYKWRPWDSLYPHERRDWVAWASRIRVRLSQPSPDEPTRSPLSESAPPVAPLGETP